MTAGETDSGTSGSVRLRIRGISKSYDGIHALEDVNFDVLPGEIHALVGESGAGRATLVKIVTGMVERHRAEVHVEFAGAG